MVEPSINELSKGKFNKYTLVIATAKCARMITDEYVKQREFAELKISKKEVDKPLAAMIRPEFRDEKAVKNAVNRLHDGRYVIAEEGEE